LDITRNLFEGNEQVLDKSSLAVDHSVVAVDLSNELYHLTVQPLQSYGGVLVEDVHVLNIETITVL